MTKLSDKGDKILSTVEKQGKIDHMGDKMIKMTKVTKVLRGIKNKLLYTTGVTHCNLLPINKYIGRKIAN